MIGLIVNLKQGLINFVDRVLGKRIIQALFHVPLLGAFLALLLGVFLLNRKEPVPGAIILGIAAQLFIPFVFAVLAFAKYIAWFLGFESINSLLFYVLAIYLFIGYALMLFAAFKVAAGKEPKYFFFTPFLQKTIAFISS